MSKVPRCQAKKALLAPPGSAFFGVDRAASFWLSSQNVRARPCLRCNKNQKSEIANHQLKDLKPKEQQVRDQHSHTRKSQPHILRAAVGGAHELGIV